MTAMSQRRTVPSSQTQSVSGDLQEQSIRMPKQSAAIPNSRRPKTPPEVTEPDCEIPTSPSKEFRAHKKEKPFAFYWKVRGLLPEWWEEFNSALDESGILKFRSVRQFALAKVKNRRQQELLCEMIGPRPDRQRLRVPWLGDWKQRRVGIQTGPLLPEQIKILAGAFRDKMAAVDAVRSAAPFLIAELGRYTKMSEEVDKGFAGLPLDRNKPPDSRENRSRCKAYLSMQFSLTRMKLELLDQWMTIHGMNPKDPMQFFQLDTISQKTFKRHGMISESDLPWREIELLKLARALQAHERNFGLRVPKELLGNVTEAEERERLEQEEGSDDEPGHLQ